MLCGHPRRRSTRLALWPRCDQPICTPQHERGFSLGLHTPSSALRAFPASGWTLGRTHANRQGRLLVEHHHSLPPSNIGNGRRHELSTSGSGETHSSNNALGVLKNPPLTNLCFQYATRAAHSSLSVADGALGRNLDHCSWPPRATAVSSNIECKSLWYTVFTCRIFGIHCSCRAGTRWGNNIFN